LDEDRPSTEITGNESSDTRVASSESAIVKLAPFIFCRSKAIGDLRGAEE
jgi:hypothetical protein